MTSCCCCVDNKVGDSEELVPRIDPTNGPLKNRSCTDVICGLLFLICIAGSALVGYFAYVYGDPKLLIYPTDSNGNLCGIGEKSSEPYLFYFDMVQCARMGPVLALVSNGCPTPQECVAECPNTYWVYSYAELKETVGGKDETERKKMFCKSEVDPWNNTVYKDKTIKELVDENLCAPYYVKSQPLAGRCIPSAFVEVANSIGDLVTTIGGSNFSLVDKDNNTITSDLMTTASQAVAYFMSVAEVAEASVRDVQSAWETIVCMIAVAVVASFFWIVMMRFVVGPMVYITFVMFIILFTVGCGFCFWKYWDILNSTAASNTITSFTTDFQQYLNVKETWLTLGIITGVLLLLILIMLIFLRKRIAIAIAILEETSRALRHVPFTLLWPIFPFIMELAVFGYCLAVALYLASSSKAQYQRTDYNQTAENAFSLLPCDSANNNSTASSICAFVKYGTNEYVIYLQLFNGFMFFWMMNFVIAVGHMTLAGSFASYYWAWEKPGDIPHFPLLGGIWRCFRYHMGTLAFGSLLIALCQIIRLVLEYIDRKTKGSDNPVAKFILKCMKCCMACLEKCLKYLCKNAYIMTAIYGRCFCLAAKDAILLLMKNVLRAAVLDKVTDLVLLISKLVIVGGVGTFAYFFYAGQIPYFVQYTPTNLNYFYVPIILIVVAAFVIATLFFSVFEMGVDTLFLCFLQDLDCHDGSADKPYYMSSSLMEILGEKNVIQKKCD